MVVYTLRGGEQGPAGEAGQSCTITEEDGSTFITCGADELQLPARNRLIYEGTACGKVVLSLGETYYVVHSSLVKLSSSWTVISNSCKVRVVDNVVYTK